MEVKSIQETVQTGKASSPYALKSGSSGLSNPLSSLFYLSLFIYKVPRAWKEANVTPVFIKDDPSDCKKIQAYPSLSTLGKVMEKSCINMS